MNMRCPMPRFGIVLTITAILILSGPVYGRDFTPDDFDPADPAMAEPYTTALGQLFDELTIIALDSNGVEVFRVMPFPVELVGLETQTAIHEGNITDSEELPALIESANLDKPTANSFAFVLDGQPEWVGLEVGMYYFPDDANSEAVRLPVVALGEPALTEDGGMVAGWAMIATDMDELNEFMSARSVVIVLDLEGERIQLNCGFWRQWALFDMRE